MSTELRKITEEQFPHEVLAAPGLVLVDFTAPWCPPCRALTPILNGLAAEGAGRWRIVEVDVDESPALASRYGVLAAPTVIVFRQGQPVRSHVGLPSRATLLGMLEAAAEGGARPARAGA